MLDFLKRTFINEDVDMEAGDWLVDIIIALGVFGIALAQLSLTAGLIIPDAFTRKMLGISVATPSMFGLLAIGATSLPLIFRRKFSWACFIFCLISWAFLSFKGDDIAVSMLPLLVSLVSLCAMRPLEDSFVAALLAFLVVGFVPSLTPHSVLSNLTMIQNLTTVS